MQAVMGCTCWAALHVDGFTPHASCTRLKAAARLLVARCTLPELHGSCRRGCVASPDRLQQSHHCVIYYRGLQACCWHSPIRPLCCTQKAGVRALQLLHVYSEASCVSHPFIGLASDPGPMTHYHHTAMHQQGRSMSTPLENGVCDAIQMMQHRRTHARLPAHDLGWCQGLKSVENSERTYHLRSCHACINVGDASVV